MKFNQTILVLGFIISAFGATVLGGRAYAQSVDTSWSSCTDGRAIVRCETYDCPRGDTNGDGKCSLTDTDAKLTDARNDSFCANPISGCGQVHYYPGSSTSSCLERVEESGLNCDLYAVASPSFSPRPTKLAAPTASPSPKVSTTPVPALGGGGDSELPKTGPKDVWIVFGILALGGIGIFLYERYRVA